MVKGLAQGPNGKISLPTLGFEQAAFGPHAHNPLGRNSVRLSVPAACHFA